MKEQQAIRKIQCQEDVDEHYTYLRDKYYPLIIKEVSQQYRYHNDEWCDLQQELELTFYKAIQTYDLSQSSCAFGAYAKICLHHRVCNMIRYHTSRKTVMKQVQTIDELTYQIADKYPEFIMDKLDKLSLIKQYCLPEEQRLIDYLLRGYSYQQIAMQLS